MRKKPLVIVVFLVVVAAGSYTAGYVHASQGVEVAAPGQAL